MLRKLAIAIAASGAMMSASMTYALGMGDIELDSALSQPLDARIKLLKASELEDWEIKPDLASREEFDKSGVERVFFLNNFEFEVERTEEGVFIRITSDQPVIEPFLNFLVQVDWPSGRLLREYTLLLDPPVFNDTEMASVSPADSSDELTEEVDQSDFDASLPGASYFIGEDDDIVSDEADSTAFEKPVMKAASVVKKVKKYAVRKNDTLWEVAVKTRGSRNVSPQQAMLAIQDLNPNAFISGNINRLKKNQVLRIPSDEEMLSRSFSEAVSEVAIQNQMIAKRKAQLDATKKDALVERDTKVKDARLKLLAGGAATTDAKRGASGKVLEKAAGDQSSLENDLNLTLENLDKSKLENQELRTRLDSLEEQINTLQRLINLKDEQMVALQTGMSAEKAIQQKIMPKESEKIAKAVDKADLNFTESEESVAVKNPIKSKDVIGSDVVASDVVDSKGVAKVDAEAKLKPKPKFVYTPPVEEDEPFDVVAFAIENPEIPGAVIGALLLALLAVRRARNKKNDEEDPLIDGAAFDGQDPLDSVDAEIEDDFHSEFDDLQLGDGESESEFSSSEFEANDFDSSDLDDFSSADAGLPDSLDDADLGEGQDVLGEVDVYMAYNRVEPARELLEKTLLQQPGRTELRVKLLEVLSEMDDSDEFDKQFDLVSKAGSNEDKAQAELIKSKFSSEEAVDLTSDLGLDLDENDQGFDLNLDEGELDFDLQGLDLSTDLEAPKPSVESSSENSNLDFDVDLSDFESDSSLDVELGTLDSDNGMDFSSSDIDSNEGLSLDSDLESLDSDLDFDTDLDLDSTLDLSELSGDIPSLTSDTALDELEFDTDLEVPSLSEGVDLDLSELSSELDDDLDLSDALDLDLSEDLDFGSSDLADGLSDNDLELDTDDSLSLDIDLDDDLNSLSADLDLDLSLDNELEASDDAPLDGQSDDDQEMVGLDAQDSDGDLPPLGDFDLDSLDEDLDFLSGTDESETKLDLARAYIDMDDKNGAKEILQEVLEEGTDKQKEDASKLMDSMA